MNSYEKIVRKHYREILGYCCVRLNSNVQAAEDCTQEVFLVLFRKLNSLDDDNIRAWLYETARRETAKYISKNSFSHISLEDAPEIEDTSNPLAEFGNSVIDRLDDDEISLIKAYYDEEDRESLAKKMRLSMNGLYLKIHRIRKKLLGSSDNASAEKGTKK